MDAISDGGKMFLAIIVVWCFMALLAGPLIGELLAEPCTCKLVDVVDIGGSEPMDIFDCTNCEVHGLSNKLGR